MTILRYTNRPNDFFTNHLMNQLFKETKTSFQQAIEQDTAFKPVTNIIDEEDYYLLEMALLGFSKNEVSVKVESGHIKVLAVKENINKERKYLKKEFGVNKLERSFKLSDGIDQEKISAEVKDGVLFVVLPKIQIEKPKHREIEIK